MKPIPLPKPFLVLILCCLAFQLFILKAHAALVEIKEHNNVVYSLFAAPNKIGRYSLENKAFLSDIPLNKVPHAFDITEEKIYVSYNRELRQSDLAGLNDSFIRNTSSKITSITSVGNYLFVVEENSNVLSIDKDSLSLIETRDSHYRGQSFISSSEHNSYYYRTTSVSPSDIHKVTIGTDGATISDRDSTYHGDYPSADKLYLNETENKIYDSAGIVYFSADLTYSGSLAGKADAIAFSNDSPIILRDEELILFNPSSIELGRIAVESDIRFISTLNETVLTFKELANSSLSIKEYDISTFELPVPGDKINPVSLNYTPEKYEQNGGDTIFMLDRENLSIFRWSISDNEYKTTLPLINYPEVLSYSVAHNRLYLGYSSGKITYFDLQQEDPIEKHLVSLPLSIHGLKAFNNYIFAADASGAWNTQYVFNKEGELLSSKDWRNGSDYYLWNPENNRMYYRSSSNIEWTDINTSTGEIGNDGGSTYHGSPLSTRVPLILINNNQLILNGGGQVLDPNSSLEILNNLGNNIQDAVWSVDKLITINENGNKYQVWKDNYELSRESAVETTNSLRLFSYNGTLIVVSDPNGKPVFDNYQLSSTTDTDSDGLYDFFDNCSNTENPNQKDTDNDGFGDACDTDDDNDGLPDNTEIAVGLDPLSYEDAYTDFDNDGFLNIVEYKLGTDINDSTSVPEKFVEFIEDFTNGNIGKLYSLGSKPWSVRSSAGDNQLGSYATLKSGETSSVFLTGDFSAGVLSFEYDGSETNYNFSLEVYLDGIETNYYLYTSSEKQLGSIEISDGIHTIEFKVTINYSHASGSSLYLINEIHFGEDTDNDSIPNSLDNCPTVNNAYQYDNDNNGIGDDCEGEYSDEDGDGVPKHRDNCPKITNVDQLNNDYDSFGDACDADIDGDGINNDVENSYSFLDAYNSNDANLDFDNDGISNISEINTGSNPEVFDEQESIYLLDYFPLGSIDLTMVYGSLKFRPTGMANEYILTDDNSDFYQKYKVTNKGIILTEAYDSFEKTAIFFNDFYIIPKEMYLGQKLIFESSATVKGNDRIFEQTNEITLKEKGTTYWNGKEYPYITLENNGYITTYLKNIGEVFSGYPDNTSPSLINIKIHSLDDASKVTSEESSGGSIPILFVLFAFLGLTFSRIRRFLK